jgi:hypothetical protein
MSYKIPDKTASVETVNKIFSQISNGRYLDILKVITEKKSYLHIFDIQNRSALHYILMNSNLEFTVNILNVQDLLIVKFVRPIFNLD